MENHVRPQEMAQRESCWRLTYEKGERGLQGHGEEGAKPSNVSRDWREETALLISCALSPKVSGSTRSALSGVLSSPSQFPRPVVSPMEIRSCILWPGLC
jgi:hypothetical protein